MDQNKAGITHKPQGRFSLNVPVTEIYIAIN